MQKKQQLVLLCLVVFYCAVYVITVKANEACAQEASDTAVEQCIFCHRIEVESFLRTTHAREYVCEVCHGDSDKHISQDKGQGAILNPANISIKRSNALCLGCHEDKGKDVRDKFRAKVNLHDYIRCHECHIVHNKSRLGYQDLDSFRQDLSVDCVLCHVRQADDFADSGHGASGMQCSDCHNLHRVFTISEDIEEQIERCLFCHPAQELEFKYAYTHPLRERQIKCSDCHNPHSARYENMLKKDKDDICADCHVDITIKSGKHPESKNTDHPFRTVKCIDCHRAHGSNFEKLLKHNINSICNTCHD